jgi:hypothetical protein
MKNRSTSETSNAPSDINGKQGNVEMENTQKILLVKEKALLKAQNELLAAEKNNVRIQRRLEKAKAMLQNKEMVLRETLRAHRKMEKQLSRKRELEYALNSANRMNAILREKILRTLGAVNYPPVKRIKEVLGAFRNRANLENQISPTFSQLRDDSYIFIHSLKGYVLQPSKYLNGSPYLDYPIVFRRAYLHSVMIAPIIEIPASSGSIGIEIVSPGSKIILQKMLPLRDIVAEVPTVFYFHPISETVKGIWHIRVFIRESDSPVRIYEWNRISFRKRGLIERKPFMGYLFRA